MPIVKHELRNRIMLNPTLAYSIAIPQPEEFELTQYERTAFPAMIGNILSMSISTTNPMYRLGRVYAFDIIPKWQSDPVFVYSPIGDLSDYYKMWKKIVLNGGGLFNRNWKKYDEAISTFVKSSIQLTEHELVFSVIEMLKFKNDIYLNN